MDLIYMDENMKDVGVFQGYSLDMAYGKDENDFVLEMPLDAPRCKAGYYIYIDGTEYGGIIDTIGVDTSSSKLVYRGRTWMGILNSKSLVPFFYRKEVDGHYVFDYEDFFYVSGDANEIIGIILVRIGLTQLFDVPEEDSGIEIDYYTFRFEKTFDGIFEMLSKYNARLQIVCNGKKPVLSAVPVMNYSSTEGFDSDIVQMKVEQTFNRVNHLICLGSGELKNRHVIHLYTDENGGIQPYLWDESKTPIKDSDYILTAEKKVLKNDKDYTEIYDYPNAETVENYEQLSEKPSDWDTKYYNYFKKDGSEYNQIEQNLQDDYQLTTSQPSNWNASYENYYTRYWSWDDGGWVYEQVEGDETTTYEVVSTEPRYWDTVYMNYYRKVGNSYVEIEQIESYSRVNSQPSDWSKNYSQYYTSDGVNYNSVSGVTKYRYNVQTVKPSDWSRNWRTAYYAPMQVMRSGKFVTEYVLLGNHSSYMRRASAPTWKKNTFYTKESYQVAPSFSSQGTVYRLVVSVPAFSSMTVYNAVTVYTKTWEQNTYFQKVADTDAGLVFKPNVYYKMVYDHYANLVAGGIERLTELANADTLDITLDDTEEEYNIGDIISATEQVTGVTTAQTIVKKIVKIERDVLTVRHEVS